MVQNLSLGILWQIYHDRAVSINKNYNCPPELLVSRRIRVIVWSEAPTNPNQTPSYRGERKLIRNTTTYWRECKTRTQFKSTERAQGINNRSKRT
jgi:hypothetical protein